MYSVIGIWYTSDSGIFQFITHLQMTKFFPESIAETDEILLFQYFLSFISGFRANILVHSIFSSSSKSSKLLVAYIQFAPESCLDAIWTDLVEHVMI